MDDHTRALKLMADIAACDAERDAAMATYIVPFSLRRQDLLAELGMALSGFKPGDTIYSPVRGYRLTITTMAAARASGLYYWTARGNGIDGPDSVFGFDFDHWRLVPPDGDVVVSP